MFLAKEFIFLENEEIILIARMEYNTVFLELNEQRPLYY